jgi:hypothetical protein
MLGAMGLRDYLRRRHERESAISTEDLQAWQAEVAARRRAAGDPGTAAEPSRGAELEPIELPGADPAELAQMIGRALAAGTPQISTASHEVDGAGEISEEILALLAGAGQLRGGEQGFAIEPAEAEQLLERVRRRLAELEGGEQERS